MKIVIVNGSPRKGNIYTAVQALAEAAGQKHEVEIIEADKLNISGCKGCGACQCMNGCIAQDDTNPTVDKLVVADMIIFTTPVYWWGMTAQLKLVIDKCYCRGGIIKGKKIGTVVIGGDSTDSVQYQLIDKQFECMAAYLNWDIVFNKSYSANGLKDLAGNDAAMDELKKIGESL